ncbi:MAG: hypothetical protein GY795_24580 [Desulfobacterales bacterium]|nr:hypothetical protein [Desulfobacterales bacterium]
MMGDDQDVAIQPAWCESEGDLEHVRRQTHDRLIAAMGAGRTSGVRWVLSNGEPALKSCRIMVSERAGTAAVPGFAESIEKIEHLLRTRGGYLVIAMADRTAPRSA